VPLNFLSFCVTSIRPDVQAAYENAKEAQEKLGLDKMLLPIDHLATRVYSQNREAAILEYLTLISYYYCGSYDISDQNSSTHVTKSVHHSNELENPAKVFTAVNHPYFVNHLLQLPSPTEAFVRNAAANRNGGRSPRLSWLRTQYQAGSRFRPRATPIPARPRPSRA